MTAPARHVVVVGASLAGLRAAEELRSRGFDGTITVIGDERYVNIGWDSGGVASGDITSPVLIALGLGAGTAVGAPDGFSLIAMAAVWPIISVQAVGLLVDRTRLFGGARAVSP